MTDKANIETAKLNLVYCHIVAPVDRPGGPAAGRSRQLCPDDQYTGLVVLTQLQPISVIFVLPEDQMPDDWSK